MRSTRWSVAWPWTCVGWLASGAEVRVLQHTAPIELCQTGIFYCKTLHWTERTSKFVAGGNYPQ